MPGGLASGDVTLPLPCPGSECLVGTSPQPSLEPRQPPSPTRGGSVWTGERGDRRHPAEQSLSLAGSLEQRVRAALLEGRSCGVGLPGSLAGRAPALERGAKAVAKRLRVHGYGKMTFPWWLEPGGAISSGAGASGWAVWQPLGLPGVVRNQKCPRRSQLARAEPRVTVLKLIPIRISRAQHPWT